ncbi:MULTISPECIES: hypothetical protein [unclassified Psychrobacter]|uniref:hypothetical protein n=1 Tax=unclassified Psychrobacter TaxID=196806 RepID=UPI0025F44AE3|nr:MULTISPECIES: hypothetical protein [unclassified Psychrobacter]
MLGQSILALLAHEALKSTSHTNHNDKNDYNRIYKNSGINNNGDEQTGALTERFH